jgi:hypothetical protein
LPFIVANVPRFILFSMAWRVQPRRFAASAIASHCQPSASLFMGIAHNVAWAGFSNLASEYAT